MSKRLSILFAAGATALCLGPPSLAQNMVGPQAAPASPAEVQQQMEKQRQELEALNRRPSDCDPGKGAAAEGPPVMEQGVPRHPASGTGCER